MNIALIHAHPHWRNAFRQHSAHLVGSRGGDVRTLAIRQTRARERPVLAISDVCVGACCAFSFSSPQGSGGALLTVQHSCADEVDQSMNLVELIRRSGSGVAREKVTGDGCGAQVTVEGRLISSEFTSPVK